MRGIEGIIADNKKASELVKAPRNLHNGEAASLVETISGKERKKSDKSILTESTETV